MAKEKTILVTGSTEGVGRLVAAKLAAQGAEVLVHGRNHVRGESLLAEIRRSGGQAVFYPADLSSLEEVRRLAEEVKRAHRHLDVLVNNAGIAVTGSTRQISADGFELHFAVNYLSGFLLTHLLLPLLKESSPARIVNVSSLGQEKIDFKDVMLEHGYSGWRAYNQSKLAQILFTFDLAEELRGSGVTVNCLHPATYMNTNMVREAGIQPISSVEDGAEAILNVVLSEDLENRTGLFFNQMRPARADAQAYDPAARRQLRLRSFALTGLTMGEDTKR
jgi:NAD(P)-dependent dehydrogenase (short-subunit alcohol dehydrogenase family)